MSEHHDDYNVICLHSIAFYSLIEEVVERLGGNQKQPDKWIGDEEAMRLLHISSRTTLQKYRDDGSIRFSQPSRKVILYDRDSILQFIENNAKNTF